MATPFVSALIDTYNHERFIEQAILSVLQQDIGGREMEVILVDDGSTDRTPEIARKFEPRVRVIRKPNGGQASAFNVGIPETRGEIVAFLDGDDWWASDKLRTVLETFAAHPDVGMVGHGLYQTDAEGRAQATVCPDQTYRLSARSLQGAEQFSRLKGFFGTSKVAYRKWVLERALPVPEECIIEADEFLWTVGVAVTDAIALDQPLFFYRFHGENLFMASAGDDARARRKLQSLAGLVRHLPQRLEQLSVTTDIADALLESLRVEAEVLRLFVEGGTRLEMFRAERAVYRLAYREAPVGYRLFKAAVLGLALVLPPQTFLRMKQAYAAQELRRFRKVLGEPVEATPAVERRVSS